MIYLSPHVVCIENDDRVSVRKYSLNNKICYGCCSLMVFNYNNKYTHTYHKNNEEYDNIADAINALNIYIENNNYKYKNLAWEQFFKLQLLI